MAHSNLKDNRKLRTLCRQLNIGKPLAVGLLQYFWWEVYDSCGKSVGRDGFLADWSSVDVATSAKWDKDPATFVEALCTAGFLRKRRRGFVVHHLADWAPDYVKKRWERAEARQKTADVVPTTADNGGQRRTKSAYGTRPDPTEPNPTQPDPIDSLRLPGAQGNPRQTRAGPEVKSGNLVGSDRAQRDKFRSLFSAQVCHALGLNGQAAIRQRKSLFAVARRIFDRGDRDSLAARFVAIATEKRDAGLDNPAAAWQKAVNETLK